MPELSSLKSSINWLIIGAQTKPYKPPKIEWVEEIVRAADRAGIPIFLKNNLKPLFSTLSLEEGVKANIFESFDVDTEHPDRNVIKIRQEMPA